MLRFRAVILLTFLLMSGIRAFSQTWCPPGAVWHYTSYSWYPKHEGMIEVRYSGDTVIEGKLCNRLVGTFSGYWNYYETDVIKHVDTYDIYFDNNVLYMYTGTFDTIVDFSADIGDSWLIPAACNGARMTVTDTGRVLVNNLSLKTITAEFRLYDKIHFDSTGTLTECTFIERIVGINSQRLMFPTSCGLMHAPMIYFSCYKDSVFPLHNPHAADCSEFVGISEGGLGSTKIYPLPFTDKLLVSTGNEMAPGIKLEMMNVQGVRMLCQMHELSTNETEINTSQFPAGVYLLRIYQKGRLVSWRKVICSPR